MLEVEHADTGEHVALKMPAHGDFSMFLELDAADWSPDVLRLTGQGISDIAGERRNWVTRVLADGVLADAPDFDPLEVFGACCRGVAWLADRRIYRWSPHPGNVYRVGGRWAIGDLGRCLAFREAECASIQVARAFNPDADLVREMLWGNRSSSGTLIYDQEREYRCRLNDCAALAGLLCWLLTRRTWKWFRQALKEPYCAAHYALTGDHERDKQLSAILNRAWRGDAGGAFLVASNGVGEQTVYDNALELLGDVTAILCDVSAQGHVS